MPLRYCPVNTPRANGDHGNRPIPNALSAGSTSTSARRASSEYSTCALASGVRPGKALCQVAAWAVCQPTKLDTPA